MSADYSYAVPLQAGRGVHQNGKTLSFAPLRVSTARPMPEDSDGVDTEFEDDSDVENGSSKSNVESVSHFSADSASKYRLTIL